MKVALYKVWNWIPHGIGVGRLVGLLMTIRGVYYLVGFTGPGVTIPYDEVLPLFFYGAISFISGLALIITASKRCTTWGRLAAVASAAILSYIAGGVINDNNILFTSYIVMAICMVREAAVSIADEHPRS